MGIGKQAAEVLNCHTQQLRQKANYQLKRHQEHFKKYQQKTIKQNHDG